MTALDILRRCAAATGSPHYGGIDPESVDEHGFSLPGGGFTCLAEQGVVYLTVYSRGRLPRAMTWIGSDPGHPPEQCYLWWQATKDGGIYEPSFKTKHNGWVRIPARRRDLARVKMWRAIALGGDSTEAAQRYELGNNIGHAHAAADHLAEPGEMQPEAALHKLISAGLVHDAYRYLDLKYILRFLHEKRQLPTEAIGRAVLDYGLTVGHNYLALMVAGLADATR